MKKLLFLFFSSFLVLWFFSFVSATETKPVPSCADYDNYTKLYEDYLNVALPLFMNPEITKSNKSQIEAFSNQAYNWIGKQARWDFMWDGTIGVWSKVQLELNKLNKKYPILLNGISESLYADEREIGDIDYTADGIKKFLLVDDEFWKLLVCNSDVTEIKDKKKEIQASLEKIKKLLKNETNKIKTGKASKVYIKAVNLAIWKQKVLFEVDNSENNLRQHCTYEPENEFYNCGG
jgi:uncharacterized protein YacL (UPF0231 family)